MQWKRIFYFLLINIIVSAITTLVVLNIWDRSHQSEVVVTDSSLSQVVIPTLTQGVVDQVEIVETPRVELEAYQVSTGETLGEIALAYDITLDELLELNGLSDPDEIGAGATIFVPVRGQPVSGGNPQVEIVAVIGAGDLDSERVQIRGIGDVELTLTGWRLQDETGYVYVFPQITLFGSGAVDIYSTTGVDTVVALYWNSGVSIWETGETVTLLDDTGNLQATYMVP
jgi:LysM repeat protein